MNPAIALIILIGFFFALGLFIGWACCNESHLRRTEAEAMASLERISVAMRRPTSEQMKAAGEKAMRAMRERYRDSDIGPQGVTR